MSLRFYKAILGRTLHCITVVQMQSMSIYRCRRKLCGEGEPVYQAIWAQTTSFDEVLVSPTMINDHMPDKVMDALEKVRFLFYIVCHQIEIKSYYFCLANLKNFVFLFRPAFIYLRVIRCSIDIVVVLPMSTSQMSMLLRGFNPDLWQYVSRVPCPYRLTVVYEISHPLNLANLDIVCTI